MPVTEFVRSTAGEGKSEDLRSALSRTIPEFENQPGCLKAQAFQGVSDEDPQVFYLAIQWESIDAHLAWKDGDTDHRRWFVENIRPLLDGANLVGHFEQFAGS